MKFNRYTYSVLALLFCITVKAQENEFSYRRKIGNITTEDWYSIALPADIFKRLQNDLSDVRIFDVKKTDTLEVRYLLDILDTEVSKQEVVLTTINQSRNGNDYLITFLNSGYKVNYLELKFEEANYFGTVRVEGSNDKKKWFDLTNDEKIFSVRNAREQYASSIVNFPLTDYNFLRLTINSTDKLTFNSAAFRLDEIKPGSFEDIPSTFSVSTDKKSKRTIVDVVLDHHRPVSNVMLEIDRKNDFYRQITVETMVDSAKTERGWIRNYQTISGNLITSFKPNQFSIPFTITKRMRITIENYDNPPLQISSVKLNGAKVQLRAKLNSDMTYLFYGNPSLYQPSYDLDHFKNKIPLQGVVASLGPEENIEKAPATINAIFENKAWLWGILIAVIAMLGFFTLRMMKAKA